MFDKVGCYDDAFVRFKGGVANMVRLIILGVIMVFPNVIYDIFLVKEVSCMSKGRGYCILV